MGNRATLIIMDVALSPVHTNPGKEIHGFREKSPDSCERGVLRSSMRKYSNDYK